MNNKLKPFYQSRRTHYRQYTARFSRESRDLMQRRQPGELNNKDNSLSV